MLKEGTKYRITKGPIHSNFGKVFETGDRGTLKRDDDRHWSLTRRTYSKDGGRGVCNDARVWEDMIANGTLVEIEPPKIYEVVFEEKCTRATSVRVRGSNPKAAAQRARRVVGYHDVSELPGEDHRFEWLSDAIGRGNIVSIEPVKS